jgi:hypothetical protein
MADVPVAAAPENNETSSEADAIPMPEAPAPEVASVEPPRLPRVLPKPMAPPARRPPAPRASPAPKEPLPAPAPMPNVAMSDLIGADFDSVLRVFRRPDNVQNNALSVVWVYSPPACTLQLFFYPDIQTSIFHLLKYDWKNAAAENSENECMQNILVPRSPGAALP